MIHLDETAAGRSVTTQVGDQLRVSLAENPTTGYRWRLASGNGSTLTLMHDESSAPAADSGSLPLPGASGMHTWLFQAHAPGNAEIRFESARSWEKTATGKTLVFPVAVKSQ